MPLINTYRTNKKPRISDQSLNGNRFVNLPSPSKNTDDSKIKIIPHYSEVIPRTAIFSNGNWISSQDNSIYDMRQQVKFSTSLVGPMTGLPYGVYLNEDGKWMEILDSSMLFTCVSREKPVFDGCESEDDSDTFIPTVIQCIDELPPSFTRQFWRIKSKYNTTYVVCSPELQMKYNSQLKDYIRLVDREARRRELEILEEIQAEEERELELRKERKKERRRIRDRERREERRREAEELKNSTNEGHQEREKQKEKEKEEEEREIIPMSRYGRFVLPPEIPATTDYDFVQIDDRDLDELLEETDHDEITEITSELLANGSYSDVDFGVKSKQRKSLRKSKGVSFKINENTDSFDSSDLDKIIDNATISSKGGIPMVIPNTYIDGKPVPRRNRKPFKHTLIDLKAADDVSLDVNNPDRIKFLLEIEITKREKTRAMTQLYTQKNRELINERQRKYDRAKRERLRKEKEKDRTLRSKGERKSTGKKEKCHLVEFLDNESNGSYEEGDIDNFI